MATYCFRKKKYFTDCFRQRVQSTFQRRPFMNKRQRKTLKGLFFPLLNQIAATACGQTTGKPGKAFDRWSEGTDDLWQRGRTHSAQCHTKGQTSTWSFCSVPTGNATLCIEEDKQKPSLRDWYIFMCPGKTLQAFADLQPFSIFFLFGKCEFEFLLQHSFLLCPLHPNPKTNITHPLPTQQTPYFPLRPAGSLQLSKWVIN